MAQNPFERLLAEHKVILAMLQKMEALLAAEQPDVELILVEATGFADILRRHERCEEDALFPTIKGMGPIQLVLQEHTRLHALRDQMDQALMDVRKESPGAPSDASIKALTHAIGQVGYCLAGHFMKEEQMAYPMAQAFLSAEQIDAIGEAMEGIH